MNDNDFFRELRRALIILLCALVRRFGMRGVHIDDKGDTCDT